MSELLHVGLDVGSTTVKIIVMDKNGNTLYKNYQRHFSDTKNTVCSVLEDLLLKYPSNTFTVALTGSGAMSAAKFLGVDFIQEVVSCKRAVEKYIPKTDVVIELGGEDAKIIYFDQSIEQRMNGTCAGGTGAFLDQMASLLHTDTQGLNELAKTYKTIYPIASRCGVFAKTDIQPLINEGAAKEDIAASIFQAVVNQTISGLACGRPIRGNVAFLGGPLNYLSELRKRFIETLNLTDDEIIVPEEAHLLVAKGAALDSIGTAEITPDELSKKIENLRNSHDNTTKPLAPLFKNEDDYKDFKKRHDKDTVVKKLSGGMKRRLGIAQALIGNPDIVLLDEPTAGLDPEERLNFKKVVREIKKDRCVVLSTHIITDIESLCDKILILSNGTITQFNSCDELANVAKGKVFAVDNTDNIDVPFYSMGMVFIDGKTYEKIICLNKIDALPLAPTVEDGYICFIENLS